MSEDDEVARLRAALRETKRRLSAELTALKGMVAERDLRVEEVGAQLAALQESNAELAALVTRLVEDIVKVGHPSSVVERLKGRCGGGEAEGALLPWFGRGVGVHGKTGKRSRMQDCSSLFPPRGLKSGRGGRATRAACLRSCAGRGRGSGSEPRRWKRRMEGCWMLSVLLGCC